MDNKMNIPIEKDKLFYSWQNRHSHKECRYFIEKAIKKALKDPTIDYELEQDMKGKSGAPILSDVIFNKIEKSYAFIADISFCAEDDQNRKYSNPNVLLELGFASRAIGWNRIILVLNEAFGESKYLPVDISDRRNPISYNLPPNSPKDVYDKEYKSFASKLSDAIKITQEAELESVKDTIRKIDKLCLNIFDKFLLKLAYKPEVINVDWKLKLKTLGIPINQIETGTGTSRMFDLGLVYVDFTTSEDGLLKLTTKGQYVLMDLFPSFKRKGGRVFFSKA